MSKIKLIIASSLLTFAMSFTAFAGSWQSDATGWWYQNDDGSYPANTWQWIDGNNDGISESYYFDASGYCLMNAITPDGRTVDATGAWVVDGTVQTQATAAPEASVPETTAPARTSTGISNVPFDGYTIVANTNTHKYHIPSCSSVRDIKPENLGYSDDAAYLQSQGYVPCKRCH